MIKKETVADLTEELILKEMGVWLEGRKLLSYSGLPAIPPNSYYIEPKDIEALRRGEMPG